MVETHPFGSFVPPHSKYLLLGSFTTKEANDANFDYQWFYANRRNQFWPILEVVYGRSLKSRREMEHLFLDLRLAIADIIQQCERCKNSNLDIHLVNIVFAVDDITSIMAHNSIEKIFFSSRGVEDKFRWVFKNLIALYPKVKFVTLPSPSPRFTMRLAEKIKKYKELLPRQD